MEGKVVLITGSSLGIGAATAKEFAKEGAKVVVTYFRDKGEGERVKGECEHLGAEEVLLIHLNLMDDQSIKDCVAEVVNKFKKIDVLVNNAGVYKWKMTRDLSFEEIGYQIRTNLEGLIKFTKQALPFIKESVINISSGAGLSAGVGYTVYSATKFGVVGFTEGLALEEPELKVYCVNPRTTATRMVNFVGDKPETVALVILKTAKGKYNLKSGVYINVWDVI